MPVQSGQRTPKWILPALFGVALIGYGAFAWRPVFWVDEYLTQSAITRPWGGLFDRIIEKDPAPRSLLHSDEDVVICGDKPVLDEVAISRGYGLRSRGRYSIGAQTR